jgi:hypothetical protein
MRAAIKTTPAIPASSAVPIPRSGARRRSSRISFSISGPDRGWPCRYRQLSRAGGLPARCVEPSWPTAQGLYPGLMLPCRAGCLAGSGCLDGSGERGGGSCLDGSGCRGASRAGNYGAPDWPGMTRTAQFVGRAGAVIQCAPSVTPEAPVLSGRIGRPQSLKPSRRLPVCSVVNTNRSGSRFLRDNRRDQGSAVARVLLWLMGTSHPVRDYLSGDGIFARSGTVPAKAMRCNARMAFVLWAILPEELAAFMWT